MADPTCLLPCGQGQVESHDSTPDVAVFLTRKREQMHTVLCTYMYMRKEKQTS